MTTEVHLGFTSQMKVNRKARQRASTCKHCVTSGVPCEPRFAQGATGPKNLSERTGVRHNAGMSTYPVSREDFIHSATDHYLEWLTQRAKANRTSDSNLQQKRYGLRALELPVLQPWEVPPVVLENRRRRATASESDELVSLADLRLCDLQRPHVIRWVEALGVVPNERGVIPRSREYVSLRCLQAVVRWAADRGAISLDIVSRIPHGYRSAPGRRLTLEQLTTLRNGLRDRDVPGHARDAIRYLRIVADNGPRACEILKATSAHVDLRAGCIRWTVGKNGRPRVVVLSEVSLLLCQLQIQEHGDGFLFPSPTKPNQPWSLQAMGRHLAAICVELGLPHTSIKDLRKSFATIAYELGVPLEDIAEALDHRSTEITKKFYIDGMVKPGARRANKAVSAAINRNGGASC